MDAIKLQVTIGSDGAFDKRGIPEKDMDTKHWTVPHAEIDPATPEQVILARAAHDALARLFETLPVTSETPRVEIRLMDGDGRV